MGRSRGGLTTKINMACDSLGRPLPFLFAAGQSHDIRAAPCFKMNAFWASKNADAFIVFRSFPAKEISAEKSNVE